MRDGSVSSPRFLSACSLAAIVVFCAAIIRAQGPGAQHPEGVAAPPDAATDDPPEHVETRPAADARAGEVTLFHSIAGSSFHPREASTTHEYAGTGCVNRTSDAGFLVADLQLPEGAEIDFLRLYFDDTDAANNNDAQAWLYSYDGLGDFTQIATVSSSGSPGQGSIGSGFFSHLVDNTNESLAVIVGMGSATDAGVQVCRVRLRYVVDVPALSYFPASP